jgi:hypothetical protein
MDGFHGTRAGAVAALVAYVHTVAAGAGKCAAIYAQGGLHGIAVMEVDEGADGETDAAAATLAVLADEMHGGCSLLSMW